MLMETRVRWGVAGAVMVVCAALAGPAAAGETNVAVAANFTEAAKEIATLFSAETEHQAVLSFGSTGQLYTQITQDAPFEVFLAADDDRPAKAIAEGYGVEGSSFTYAIGKLVLWSSEADLVKDQETLKAGDFQKIAVANPETAPYGTAAVEAMKALGVYDALKNKIVQGNNIAQTYQFVETANAELGFVAKAQLAGNESGSRWEVPGDLYNPIKQDAVLLKKGEANDAARAFVAFLRSPAALAVIEKYGYGVESAN
ncbi:molybdate transport system substrate-binding protein [Nitratireductor indicus]|nr:molybdate ABC transporter substrate-binding protein [Nitratireductor indicus]SFQ56406.1 molybdate transport system substrate-binding protein [Nitratireductor indicus]